MRRRGVLTLVDSRGTSVYGGTGDAGAGHKVHQAGRDADLVHVVGVVIGQVRCCPKTSEETPREPEILTSVGVHPAVAVGTQAVPVTRPAKLFDHAVGRDAPHQLGILIGEVDIAKGIGGHTAQVLARCEVDRVPRQPSPKLSVEPEQAVLALLAAAPPAMFEMV